MRVHRIGPEVIKWERETLLEWVCFRVSYEARQHFDKYPIPKGYQIIRGERESRYDADYYNYYWIPVIPFVMAWQYIQKQKNRVRLFFKIHNMLDQAEGCLLPRYWLFHLHWPRKGPFIWKEGKIVNIDYNWKK